VWEVPLVSRTIATHWTLDALNGVITEVTGNLGTANDIICSYTTDYVMPAVYPPPLVDTPDLGESRGEWEGLPIVPGTYTLDLYGYVNRVVTLYGETNTYRGTSPGVWTQFLVGSATTVEPYALISSGNNCYACHDSIWFHGGGRRGFETCIVCHATSAPEDRPSTSTPTPMVTVSFREMLHKIHRATDLPDAATYPFEAETGFPAMPGGVKQCVKCHGSSDVWMAPHDRTYPGSATLARNWTVPCASCHSSVDAKAHIDIQAPDGVESCEVCHGAGRSEEVAKVHETK
jgi:OmcA/MtrC family decaheme c-type cytochrome